MNQSTRYFLIGSAAVVLLGLGTGLVAYYNGGLPTCCGQTSDAELGVPAGQRRRRGLRRRAEPS